ncbi:hypothetical protein EII20_13840 [Comamonadaceae bacterium OH2545_COT-014]|nr:hypothetical protein EII20_13840 [Comamonadaceae bacterium OH2545_COT-014]
MGWLFTTKSRSELIQALTCASASEKGTSTTLAYVFNEAESVLWSVVELRFAPDADSTDQAPRKHCIICCNLLECSGGQWGYKPMDESMHPYRYSCPLAFLTLAPVACQEWRDKVRQYHGQH